MPTSSTANATLPNSVGGTSLARTVPPAPMSHPGAAASPAVPGWLTCEPGRPRRFGRDDVGTDGLIRGWSAPEKAHVWNDGLDATLGVVLADPGQVSGGIVLVIRGEPYVTGQQPRQHLTAYVNGWRAGFWRFTERRDTSLAIRFEPEWWLLRDGRSFAQVTFHLPYSARPMDLGDGQDGRELGFCLHSLVLRADPA